MDRRNLPLTALRSFEAVGRHLSFTRAADSLGVTHGAVSRQITLLETNLGVRLFNRGATLTLTDQGQKLFEEVAPAFDRLAAAVATIDRGETQRVLLVNAPPTFTMKWLIPRLSRFHQRFRDVDVRLSTGIGALRELRMNEVDVVIRRLARPDPDVPSAPFLSSALFPVCAPELIERRPPTSPQDIADLQLIEAETGALGWADWFGRLGYQLPPSARFARFEQMFFALEAALDGLGIALMPSALVLDDIAAGRLTVALKVTGFHERDYYSLCSPLTRQAELSQAFVAWLGEEGADSNRLAELIIDP
jgi:LysR family glycine cleavage system transcriptional activator